MASQILKLSNDLINKIAAGEVVERPASVVKELVENALDAAAKNVVIKIHDGGRKLVQVSDDGHGIPAHELELAVARHTTSKIQKFEDLYALGTKGFRGEALASIASVSRFSLASATAGSEASEIIVHAGEIIDKRSSAQPKGTTVVVKHLFYQTPARLKFLRTKETETSHIVTILTKLALSHPQVDFRLYEHDRLIFEAPVFEDEKKRVLSLLGKDLDGYLYAFSGEAPGFKVKGYLSHPNVARSQRTATHFFVNGRAVNDKILWHAVMEAYRDLLMRGKYPILVLDLWVDEKTLDVNVHPTKAEVRFHNTQAVHAFVKNTLRERLQAAPWVKTGGPVPPQADHPTLRFSGLQKQDPLTPLQQTLENPSQRQIAFGKTPYAEMHPIGQALGTYILCETQGKLILIDQHAAHERVGFEKLLLAFEKNGIPQEDLLVPETFDLKPSETDILKHYTAELEKFGFTIDFFGGNTFVLKAVPTLLKGKIHFKFFLQDLLADILESGELISLKDKFHHVLATMACHGQIRAHYHLNLSEISHLLRELDEYQFTDFCPHGRPVCVEITNEEIEKWFRRTL